MCISSKGTDNDARSFYIFIPFINFYSSMNFAVHKMLGIAVAVMFLLKAESTVVLFKIDLEIFLVGCIFKEVQKQVVHIGFYLTNLVIICQLFFRNF